MAKANDPSKITAAVPRPVPAAPAPVAAAVPGLTPQVFSRRLLRLDMALVVLTVVLAFFLGAFAAHNADLYMHLGLGGPFGEASDWPHHAWLPSVLVGLFYEPLSGGAAVAIVLKALVVVGLAVVLLLIRRRGQAWILPVAFAALAVLVASPRFLLQPFVLSLWFLGVTLLVLLLPPRQYPRAVWWLPALFALWVNCDAWYVLGPLTVALFLLGEWLQGKLRIPAADDVPTRPDRLLQLVYVLLAGAGACLVNPWLFRGLTLPMELGYILASILDLIPDFLNGAGRMVFRAHAQDPELFPQISPFFGLYWAYPERGESVAGLAYFILLGATLASFLAPAYLLRRPGDKVSGALGRAGFTMPLFVVFLFFVLLSVWSYRLIALFAVVAGPVAALNWQDYLRRRYPTATGVTAQAVRWGLGSRFAALAVTGLLVVGGWAGWLHAGSDNWFVTRHVAFTAEEDPGVLRAAKVIAEIQRQTGQLKLGFNYNIDGGDQLLFAALRGEPSVKLFADSRFGLRASQGEDFGKVRKALRDEAEVMFTQARDRDEQQKLQKRYNTAEGNLREVFKKHGIDYVVVSQMHRDGWAERVARRLKSSPAEWTLLYDDGRTAVFGWNLATATAGEVFAKYRFNLALLTPPTTFPPNAPAVALTSRAAPPLPTGAYGAWQTFLYGPPSPSLWSYESDAYRDGFAAASEVTRRGPHPVRDNLPVVAGWVGYEALFAKPVALHRDVGPPAAMLLSVRAARNAVLDSPDDALPYLKLKTAYEFLLRYQEEYWVFRPQPPSGTGLSLYKPASLRYRVRHAQMSGALVNAAVLQPESWQLQVQCGEWFLSQGYLDVAGEYITRARDLALRQKPASAEEAEMLKRFRDNYGDDLKQLNAALEQQAKEYGLLAKGQPDPLEKLKAALLAANPEPKDPLGFDKFHRRGLVLKALAVLGDARANLGKLKAEDAREVLWWNAYLLLMTGKLGEADTLLKDPAVKKALGELDHAELAATVAAAVGDYPAADKLLEATEKFIALPPDEQILEAQKKPLRDMAHVLAVLTAYLPGPDDPIGPLSRLTVGVLAQGETYKELSQLGTERVEVFQVRLLRGLLALESGDLEAAARHLHGALRVLPPVLDHPDRPIAVRYTELLEGK
jgi:hypothetical protein